MGSRPPFGGRWGGKLTLLNGGICPGSGTPPLDRINHNTDSTCLYSLTTLKDLSAHYFRKRLPFHSWKSTPPIDISADSDRSLPDSAEVSSRPRIIKILQDILADEASNSCWFYSFIYIYIYGWVLEVEIRSILNLYKNYKQTRLQLNSLKYLQDFVGAFANMGHTVQLFYL